MPPLAKNIWKEPLPTGLSYLPSLDEEIDKLPTRLVEENPDICDVDPDFYQNLDHIVKQSLENSKNMMEELNEIDKQIIQTQQTLSNNIQPILDLPLPVKEDFLPVQVLAKRMAAFNFMT
jgi:hypothetical protein